MRKAELLQEIITGIFIVGVGGLYLLLTLFHVEGIKDAFGMSSRTLPYIVSSVLICLGLILSIRNIRVYSSAIDDDSDKETSNTKKKYIRIFKFFVAINIYFVGILYISYLLSTALMLAYSMYFCEFKNKIAFLIITLITPVCIYYIFARIMMIPLPDTLLGF
ncbi:MAG: tripartite tricarboxylate transporter TctB family protein [Syntrophobacteraceae bacterium]